ncbi:DMT family transporter [Ensifer soli]|uniref:DMT family transporter n=1 Tax=Ciceribacter sp. sgz301302 TaxID=3342379 RepID=UPI0035B9BE49
MTLDRLAPTLFVLLWSTGWIAAKYAALSADPLTFLVMRYALAGLLLAGFSLLVRAEWPRGRTGGHALVSGILLHGLYLGPVWWAIGAGVPAALAGIIAGLQPLMTAAVAPWFLGERISPLQRLGLVIGLAGIAVAVAPKLAGGAGLLASGGWPIVVNIAGMASVTLGTLYQKRYLQQGDIRAIAPLQYAGALLVTLPAAVLIEPMRVTWGLPLLGALAWSVFGLSIGAIALLLYLIRRGQVSKAASLIYLVPPLAALEAAVAFGEPLTVAMIAGTLLCVAGVYLANRRRAGG